MAPLERFELPTFCFEDRISSAELQGHDMNLYLIDLTFFGFYPFDGNFGFSKVLDAKSITHQFSNDEINEFRSIIANPNNKIVLHALTEAWTPAAINSVLELLEVAHGASNAVLLLDTMIRQGYPKELNTIRFDNILFYDYFLAMTAEYEDSYGSNDVINLTTNKFLYMMGKPFRPNRIELLYDLYQRDRLVNCDWSFHYDERLAKKTRERLPNLTDVEYDEFVSKTQRSLDPINVMMAEGFSHYHGYPVDHSLYAKTSFSLISETPDWWPRFLTEKTWRTIANRHAFVTTSYHTAIDALENLGIDTFQYMLNHSKNVIPKDHAELTTLTIDNTIHFLENIDAQQEQIKLSINNNYAAYRAAVAKERSIVCVELEGLLKPRRYEKQSPIIKVQNADEVWCPLTESNRRPTAYWAVATTN